jgi:hypothetical protein
MIHTLALSSIHASTLLGALGVIVLAALALLATSLPLVAPLMMFQRINKDKAERIFTIQQNVSGVTIPAGGAVAWDVGTPDGSRVGVPVTATLSCFVGLAANAIVNSAYGLVQTYGYKAAAPVANGTVAIVAGDVLVPVTAVTYLARSGAADGKSGFIMAAGAVATGTGTTANVPVFLRCL